VIIKIIFLNISKTLIKILQSLTIMPSFVQFSYRNSGRQFQETESHNPLNASFTVSNNLHYLQNAALE